ncbi:hypothetical protein HKCCE3408_09915 [Rhodobacterales bacterium HKCCE3408]|nr:hypothetical protein [Rhodobacterales bacterium HKCCE3408]
MRLALAMVLAAAPAMADPLGLVDYDALIDANMDRAREAWGGNRVITFEDGTEVIFSANGIIRTREASDRYSIGCLALTLAQISAVARTCPGVVGPGDADHVDTAIGAMIPVYANSIRPEPADPEEVGRRFEELVQRVRASEEFSCLLSPQFYDALGTLTAPGARSRVEDWLTPPRLPVDEPCY